MSKKDRSKVVEMLREITTAQTYSSARKRMDEAIDALETSHPRVDRMLEENGEDTLTISQLPVWQRKGMKSTNMLERYNQDLKRRTRVVRIFPNQESCLHLVAALAMEMT